MTAIAQQQVITIRDRQITLGRLTSSREAKIFFEYIAPAVGPIVGDLLDRLAPFVEMGVTGKPLPAGMLDKPLGLAVSVEKLVTALPWEKVEALAQQVLACTLYKGKPIWPQLDAVCETALDWIKLVVQALQFLYSDFFEALGSLPFLARNKQQARSSEGSTESAGPSGE